MTAEETDRLAMKIAAVEELTTAEMRVALLRPSWLGIKRAAGKVFEKHRMHETAGRNAVLIAVDLKSHEILVYGDEGFSERVDAHFFDDVRDAMIDELRAGRVAAGLSAGIQLLGRELARLFPRDGQQRNELPDAIIIQ
jgi:uncharacterized membrane protein